MRSRPARSRMACWEGREDPDPGASPCRGPEGETGLVHSRILGQQTSMPAARGREGREGEDNEETVM